MDKFGWRMRLTFALMGLGLMADWIWFIIRPHSVNCMDFRLWVFLQPCFYGYTT